MFSIFSIYSHLFRSLSYRYPMFRIFSTSFPWHLILSLILKRLHFFTLSSISKVVLLFFGLWLCHFLQILVGWTSCKRIQNKRLKPTSRAKFISFLLSIIVRFILFRESQIHIWQTNSVWSFVFNLNFLKISDSNFSVTTKLQQIS